jgi:hypothetical protein
MRPNAPPTGGLPGAMGCMRIHGVAPIGHMGSIGPHPQRINYEGVAIRAQKTFRARNICDCFARRYLATEYIKYVHALPIPQIPALALWPSGANMYLASNSPIFQLGLTD